MAGRPKLDPTAKRSKLLQMRVTAAELALIKRAAHLDETSPSDWVRSIVTDQASQRVGAGDAKKATKRAG